MSSELLVNTLFVLTLLLGSVLAVILFNRASYGARIRASEEELRKLEENMRRLSKELEELKKEIIALRREISEEP